MNSTTRRDALIAIVGAAAASAAPYSPQTFKPDEMELVSKLADLMIPRTDTPGASDAGVPEFIDQHLTASPDAAAIFRHGLAQLPSDFLRQPPEQQAAILTRLADTDFFRTLKDLTIDGYYSSREGLVEELGWHGNTFLTEFKGCTHPEHQA